MSVSDAPRDAQPPSVVLRMAGLAAVLLVATLGQGGGAPTSLLAWHAGLALVAVAWLTAGGCRRRPDGPGSLALAAFVLLFAVGALRVDYGYAALLVSLELGACLLAARLAADAGPGLLEALVWPLRIGAAVQATLGLAQWIASAGSDRAVGTFYNPNHLGLWLVALLLLSVGAGARGRLARIGLVLTAVPTAVAIPLTGSRGAALGAAAGIGWLLHVHWRGLDRRARTVLLVVVVAAGALMTWRIGARLGEADPFRYQRLRIWSASLQMVAAEPWWGSGPGQFRTAARNFSFPDGDGPLRFDRAFTVSHSDLIRVPAELGIPAALALAAALAWAVRGLYRRHRRDELTPAGRGAVAALIAIGTHALVDNPSKWPAVYLLASVLLGALLASERRDPGGFARPLRLALALLLAVVFVAADLAPYLAWRQVHGLPRGRLDAAGAQRLARALELNPLHPDYALRQAEHLAAAADLDLLHYARAREAAERAVRLHPREARYHRGLARIEARAFRALLPFEPTRDRARAHYRRAEQLARYDPFAPIGLAAFLVDTGDAAGARRAAERAMSLEPRAVLPRLLLADAFIESGRPDDLVRAGELIEQARALAAQAPAAVHGTYAERLLALDPRVVERLERRIRERRPPDPGPGASP